MQTRSRIACLSAAVLAVWSSGSLVRAADLTWDVDPSTAGVQDGSGNWDLSTTNWYDPTASTNAAWPNTGVDNATLGNATNVFVPALATAPFDVDLANSIVVNNLALGTGTTGAFYDISDFGGGSLTLNGNLAKVSAGGNVQLLLATNGLMLSAGNHVVSARDTSGDATPELIFNSAINGTGSITIDNSFNNAGAAADVQYGTTAFNVDNNYGGGTTIASGRLEANTSKALGTGGVVVSGGGQLAFAGPGTTVGDLTIANAIQITRSDYATANTNNRYADAIIANNDGSNNTVTFSGAFDVASTDARVSANTNTIVINSNITSSTGNGVLTVDGDFAGFVTLNGNNAGLATGGVKLIGGVELNVNNDNNLGGANSPLTFSGSATLHPVGGFLTSFGTHVINAATFSGGIDVDANQTFTIANSLGTAGVNVGSVGKRGLGTLVLSGTNFLLGGQTFFDSGTVNVTGATTLANLHLRSPIVNISQGGSITTTAGYNSLGQDSTATNGGPDKATVNISGNGMFTQNDGSDFNVSDNANTAGTINVHDTGALTSTGTLFLGKSLGAVGTINVFDNASLTAKSLVFVGQNNGTGVVNQTGGSITLTRNANFTFVIGDGRGGTHANGTYNLSAGTFTSAGEVYAGEGNNTNTPGNGKWLQTGGVANVNNWFVVGREGAIGTLDISGGTLNHNGGNMSLGDSGVAGGGTDIINLHGNGVINNIAGETWVGNGGATATMTIADTASLTVNNWFAIGRSSAASVGVVNQTGGSVIKTAGSAGYFAIGSGGSGTYNQSGGSMTISGTRIGEASSGTLNISAGTDVFTNEFSVGYTGGGIGTLNISGTANVTVPGAVLGVTSTVAANGGIINLNGGTLSGASFTAGAAATELARFNFNGGTLKPTATNTTNFVGAKVQSNVLGGGAIVDTNGFNVTVTSALLHGGTAATDGGLAKLGAGTLVLTGANTYTGATIVNNIAGTLRTSYSATVASASTPLLTGPSGLDIRNGQTIFDYAGSTTPLAIVKSALTAAYASNFATGQIRSTTSATATGRSLGYHDDGTSTVTVKATFAGDANLDGTVDASDFVLLSNNFGSTTAPNWDQGNFNYDGSVDASDFVLLSNNFGASVGTTPLGLTSAQTVAYNNLATDLGFSDAQIATWDAKLTAVPEPTTLAAFGLMAAAFGRRTRRPLTANA